MSAEIHFTTETLLRYAATGVICTAIPILLAVFWRKRTYESWVVFIVGFLAYFAAGTVRILLRMLMFGDGSFLNSSPFLFYLVQGLLSGLCEETARYSAFKYPLRNRTQRTASIMYGLGHDFYETLAVAGFASFHYVLDGIDWNNLGEAEFTRGLDEAAAKKMLEGVAAAADFSFLDSMLVTLDCISGTVTHIALSVIVFKAVQTGDWKRWLMLAIVLHTMGNFLCGYLPLSDTGMHLFSIVQAAALGWFAYRVYKELPYA